MYSQSKGRQFSEGEQERLVDYLTQTCPLDPSQETEQDRKLNLILSKVQVNNQGQPARKILYPDLNNPSVRGVSTTDLK